MRFTVFVAIIVLTMEAIVASARGLEPMTSFFDPLGEFNASGNRSLSDLERQAVAKSYVKRVSEIVGSAPQTQAEILHASGNFMVYAGNGVEGLVLLEKALKLYGDSYMTEGLESFGASLDLAGGLLETGRPADARRTVEEAGRAIEEVQDRTNSRFAQVRLKLARLLAHLGDTEDALKHYVELVKHAEAQEKPDANLLASYYLDMGIIFDSEWNYPYAGGPLKKAVELLEASVAADKDLLLECYTNYSDLLISNALLSEARKTAEKGIALLGVPGEAQPELLRFKLVLARIYLMGGRNITAQGELESILAVCEDYYPADHEITLSTGALLASAAYSVGDLKKSVQRHRSIVKQLSKSTDLRNQQMEAESITKLLHIMVLTGNFDVVEALRERVQKLPHFSTQAALFAYALTSFSVEHCRGKDELALLAQLLWDSIDDGLSNVNPKQVLLPAVRSHFVSKALITLGKTSKVEKLHSELFENEHWQEEPRLDEAEEIPALAFTAELYGDDEKAEELLRQGIEAASETYNSHHPLVADNWFRLARIYADRDDHHRASEYMEKALSLWQLQDPHLARHRISRCAEVLKEVYQELNQQDKADQMQVIIDGLQEKSWDELY